MNWSENQNLQSFASFWIHRALNQNLFFGEPPHWVDDSKYIWVDQFHHAYIGRSGFSSVEYNIRGDSTKIVWKRRDVFDGSNESLYHTDEENYIHFPFHNKTVKKSDLCYVHRDCQSNELYFNRATTHRTRFFLLGGCVIIKKMELWKMYTVQWKILIIL